jgi:hypothetical protein
MIHTYLLAICLIRFHSDNYGLNILKDQSKVLNFLNKLMVIFDYQFFHPET